MTGLFSEFNVADEIVARSADAPRAASPTQLQRPPVGDAARDSVAG
jgi:hypothetical protein